MTKSLTTRLNVVVSRAPVAARLRKLRAFSGAESASISISIAPASVSSVTHCPTIFSTDAPSNGSGLVRIISAGLALAFFAASLAASDFIGSCDAAMVTQLNARSIAGNRCLWIEIILKVQNDCNEIASNHSRGRQPLSTIDNQHCAIDEARG